MKVNLNKEVIEGLLLEQGCCYLLHDYRELLIEHLGAEKFVPKMKLVTQRDAQDFAKKTKSGKNCLACALLDKFFQWQRKNNPRAFNDLSS